MSIDRVYERKDSVSLSPWTTGLPSSPELSLTRPGSVDGSVDGGSKVSWRGNEALGYGIDDGSYSDGDELQGHEMDTLNPVQLTSWLQDARIYIETSDNNVDPISSRPFSNISAVIALPNSVPDPLRPSRKPLPSGSISQGAFAKAPPLSFYGPYLDSLLQAEGPAAQAAWQSFHDARLDQLSDWTRPEASQDRHSDPLSDSRMSTIRQIDKDSEQPYGLAKVPSLFFDPEFDLTNPLTWESLDILAESPSPTPDDNLQMLSNHLDTLESHLVKEISKRSPMFFSALDNLQRLTAQSSACLEQIVSLQSELRQIDWSVSQKGLRLSHAQHDLDVQRTVFRSIQQIQVAYGALALSKRMSRDNNWMGTLEALDAFGEWLSRQSTSSATSMTPDPITNTQTMKQSAAFHTSLPGISEEGMNPLDSAENLAAAHIPEPGFDLTSLDIVKDMRDQLQPLMADTRGQIETELLSRFLSVLAADSKVSESDMSPAMSDSPLLPVLPLLSAFHRCGGTEKNATAIWRIACLRSTRDTIREVRRLRTADLIMSYIGRLKQHLQMDGFSLEIDEADNVTDPKSLTLADQLKSMGHDKFMTLSRRMYASMLRTLHRIKALQRWYKLALETAFQSTPANLHKSLMPTSSEEVDGAFELDQELQSVVLDACNLANSKSAKIFSARYSQQPETDPQNSTEIAAATRTFVLETEVMAGQMLIPLRAALTNQARIFLATYHADRLQTAAKLVEEEQWIQREIPSRTCREIERLVSSATHTAISQSDPTSPMGNTSLDDANDALLSSPSSVKALSVEDQKFILVHATVSCLDMLCSYVRLLITLDSVVTDVMAKLIEFLKAFNSRTCQVVLGAGAMRSAGLKNITAKHLALASQSLSVMITLIPYVREYIRRHLNPKQAVMLIEFDKLKRDFQEHQYEIHAKLIAIMADRLHLHLETLKSIDWEATTTSPVNLYAELLVKEATTLHRVLYKYLAKGAVESIMLQVVEAIWRGISTEYDRIELTSEHGKHRMQADADWLVHGLAGLSGSDLPSPISDLASLVKGKQLPRKAAQMGASINGFLRRGNRPKSEPTTGVDNASQQSKTQLDDITHDISESLFESEPTADGAVLGRSSESRQAQTAQPERSAIEPGPSSPSANEVDEGGDNGIDHFEALELDPDADQDDIKRAYRRLVMQLHPDKRDASSEIIDQTPSLLEADKRLQNVYEAYRILSDTDLRRDYVQRRSKTGITTNSPGQDRARIATSTISLDDFEYHEQEIDATVKNGAKAYYTHPCRCSHELMITEEDLENGLELLDCTGCGERIAVGYKVAG